MADNVGNADARPDLDLDEAFGDDRPTINEQEMAEAAKGCGQTAIGIPMGASGRSPRWCAAAWWGAVDGVPAWRWRGRHRV